MMLDNKVNHNILEKIKQQVLICFSHLRWDFVYQRPQHLMSRFAKNYTVLFVEEPVYIDETVPSLSIKESEEKVFILVPLIPKTYLVKEIDITQAILLDKFLIANDIKNIFAVWYYSPMFITWTRHITAKVIVYDCMDELAAFKNAPVELQYYEKELFSHADLIFTGGISLYEAKSLQHEKTYPFPSSVDINHFNKARHRLDDPHDQKSIAYPRLGFYGVIDERLDIKLIEALAHTKPEWNLILIGPIVKIDPKALPKLNNIYYLGIKGYNELPNYLSNWDVALLPFILNDSTKYISPTKTPEYLAGGKPVVSTPITDVIRTYQNDDIIYIANPDNIDEFIEAIYQALSYKNSPDKVHIKADAILKNMSWDKTFNDMHNLMLSLQERK